MTKRFYIDEKVTIWRRTWYSSELENGEEKLIKTLEEGDEIPDEIEMEESEVLYETEELMTPQDNDNQSTIEVYSEDGKILWTNEPKKEVQQ